MTFHFFPSKFHYKINILKCKLNKYLFDCKRHDTGLCDSCHVQETIKHYMIHCTVNNFNNVLLQACQTEEVPYQLEKILQSDSVFCKIYPYIDRDIYIWVCNVRAKMKWAKFKWAKK